MSDSSTIQAITNQQFEPDQEKLGTTTGSIKIKGGLLTRAKKDDFEALSTIFHQFIPAEEEILFAEFFGTSGFAYVTTHSFACLTDKRVASLSVGPFKKVQYEDGFHEDMTSGGIYQPSKFWLYIYQIFGFIAGLIVLAIIFQFILDMLLSFLGLAPEPAFDSFGGGPSLFQQNLYIVGGLLALPLMPFLMSSIISSFYRFNPSGVRCWVRQKAAITVSVSRDKMIKANRLYKLWSELRDDRIRHIKNKLKRAGR